jgi:hypothetical protein
MESGAIGKYSLDTAKQSPGKHIPDAFILLFRRTSYKLLPELGS